MAGLAQVRTDVAAAVQAVDAALNIRTRPVKNARPNDGWVIVERVAPATYTACEATLTAVVLLGSTADETKAEDRFEALAVALVDAVTTGDLHPSDVRCEPATVLVGDPGVPMYALTLTLTLEVD